MFPARLIKAASIENCAAPLLYQNEGTRFAGFGTIRREKWVSACWLFMWKQFKVGFFGLFFFLILQRLWKSLQNTGDFLGF